MNLQELMKKELLTADEAKAVMEADPKWADKYLFHNFWNNTYLNLDVYSEVEHQDRVYRMECGL